MSAVRTLCQGKRWVLLWALTRHWALGYSKDPFALDAEGGAAEAVIRVLALGGMTFMLISVDESHQIKRPILAVWKGAK